MSAAHTDTWWLASPQIKHKYNARKWIIYSWNVHDECHVMQHCCHQIVICASLMSIAWTATAIYNEINKNNVFLLLLMIYLKRTASSNEMSKKSNAKTDGYENEEENYNEYKAHSTTIHHNFCEQKRKRKNRESKQRTAQKCTRIIQFVHMYRSRIHLWVCVKWMHFSSRCSCSFDVFVVANVVHTDAVLSCRYCSLFFFSSEFGSCCLRF